MSAKRVVITGVTRGLGRALVAGVATAGHAVFGCGRDREALTELQAELQAELASSQAGEASSRCELRPLDITSDQVAAWAREIVGRNGPPDLVIANAGVIHRAAPLWELEIEETRRVIETNVVGVLRTLHAFLPAMVERRAGIVALLSSGWGRSASPEVATYCASKWAIEGLTRALAQELPTGMAAVSVNPGVIDTDMLRQVWGESAATYPDAKAWAERAVPFFLDLRPRNNGEALTV